MLFNIFVNYIFDIRISLLYHCDYFAAKHPANYSYGDPSKDGKKRIVVYGTIPQIEIALRLIEDKIRLEDGVGTMLQDLCQIKVPGSYSKMLTDELPDDPYLASIVLSPLPAGINGAIYIVLFSIYFY